jgi:hypothetical protein
VPLLPDEPDDFFAGLLDLTAGFAAISIAGLAAGFFVAGAVFLAAPVVLDAGFREAFSLTLPAAPTTAALAPFFSLPDFLVDFVAVARIASCPR